MATMRAAVFVEPGRIILADKPIPDVGPNDALLRITTTTICGTDVHILKGEYPVAKGLTIGHEPVGIIEKLGSAVEGYTEGSESSLAPLRRAARAMLRYAVAFPRTARRAPTVSRRWAGGGSAIRSTDARPNLCWYPTQPQI